MAEQKLIGQVLEMPSSMPLFNYEISFKNLRSLLEDVNVQTGQVRQGLRKCEEKVCTKLPTSNFQELQLQLNESLKFGLYCNKFAETCQSGKDKNNRKELHQMNNMQSFAWKTARLTDILEHLIQSTNKNQQKIAEDDHRHELAIQNSFRRIDEKLQNGLDAMTKNINLYFTDTNSKLSTLQTDVTEHKRNTAAIIEEVKNSLNGKVGEVQLQTMLNGLGEKVKNQMVNDLKDDNMKRLAALNQYSNKLKEHIKDVELKAKATKNTVKQLSEKVSKLMPTQQFQIEKHKIFEKLSEHKNKIDDFARTKQELVDFRKSFYEINQRFKQNILGIEDDIKKLRQNGSNFKKMEDIGSVLEALDPHLICELSSQTKLHEKQIGKMEKQIVFLENELQTVRKSESKMPEVNNGQTSDQIMKIVKEYMTNLDFEGRMKRAEKQIHDNAKKNDGVNELGKKIAMLSKDIDMGSIMREIQKKADDEAMKRDNKILDAKLDKLFDFYKQVRKQLEFFLRNSRNGASKETDDNPSLTTKKLHSPNCISCIPKTKPLSSRRSTKKQQTFILDESMEQFKNSMYVRGTF